ncbi:hypothetical protein H072_6514 [Dactylellina haptotyla CBS 200.50]|uniref:4Fe-4S ferredoxin-type domain-containing protein n=1 Tax=Dactylellina haptotyla (strain CBS 200.50) TaxID=1284197 RepID=S8BWH8_DACHA|nr:hypothetical protein H072_6514 [Dactylellina haptotyla CBS 200.50]
MKVAFVLSLLAATASAAVTSQRCGGLVGIPCPTGQTCKTPAGCADCFGVCTGRKMVKREAEPVPAPTGTARTKCGGLVGIPCPTGEVCVTPTGCADCFGVCVAKPTTTKCGGLVGIPCPSGLFCLTPTGCADCFGVCVVKDPAPK